ncbi:hypothetical protein SAMN05444274_103442 [Mariniphaga anaerophila]|uniref:Uncharacterized protein n=1 Tax=Mariniphaga anaerophila TaxID=1484053 RepID=A0A1M4YRZ6_9BACT|nr:hypothetical protein SAMN05444274_103442 [Mariniphaga anaerophila]
MLHKRRAAKEKCSSSFYAELNCPSSSPLPKKPSWDSPSEQIK